MSKIKIITDSTAYISREDLDKLKVDRVSLAYVLEGESFREGYPGDFQEFFDSFSKTNEPMGTSQPSTGDFLDVFNKAFDEGYDEIIAILLSSNISGTYTNAILARNMLEDKKITVVDSQSTVANLRHMVEDAVALAEEGKSSEEIISYVESKKKESIINIIVGDLKYLAKGGRMSSISSIMGNLLKIKPIITLEEGKLVLLDKVRGKKQALSRVIEDIPKEAQKVSICHIICPEEAGKVKEMVKKNFPDIECTIEEIGPVIGSHLGPGTLAVCIY